MVTEDRKTANEKYDAMSEQKRHVILGLFIAQIVVVAPFAWKAASTLRNDIGPLDPGFAKPDLPTLKCLDASTTIVVEPCGLNDRICETHRSYLVNNALPSANKHGVDFRVVDNVAGVLPPLRGSETEDEGVVRKWLDTNAQSLNGSSGSFTIVYHFSRHNSVESPYRLVVSSGNLGWISVDSDETAVSWLVVFIFVHFVDLRRIYELPKWSRACHRLLQVFKN